MLQAHIDSLVFKSGLKITLSSDSILVLVGPNNSGKSATLRDIKGILSDDGYTPVTVSDLSIARTSTIADIEEFIGAADNNGNYQVPGFGFHTSNLESWWSNESATVGPFLTKYLVLDLSTRARLGDCDPPQLTDLRNKFNLSHPFHVFYRNPKIEEDVSGVIRRAFKADLVVHRSAGASVPVYIGKRPKRKKDEERTSERYSLEIEKLAPLEQQGDGIRSFVSIISRVYTEYRPIHLLDEPEAFLHPPQARMVAENLASHGEKKQTFLATHSSEIVQGLLASHSKRVSVVRLTRTKQKASALHLTSEQIVELWSNPILRFSNVLDGLFHDGVILTEADADCRFYETLANAVVPGEERPDIHYTYSGGKDRLPTVVQALVGLGVPVATIADFDLLNNEQPLRRVFEAHGGVWDDIEADWMVIKRAVEAKEAFVGGTEFKKQVGALIKAIPDGTAVAKDTLSQIKVLAQRASPWENVKNGGTHAIPAGAPSIAVSRLLKTLAKKGLFVVPVGEMEGFCRTIGGHGPKWVQQALDHDVVNSPQFEEARKFVLSVVDSIRDRSQ